MSEAAFAPKVRWCWRCGGRLRPDQAAHREPDKRTWAHEECHRERVDPLAVMAGEIEEGS